MATLKGDKAAQRKRRLQDKRDQKRGDDRTPRMEPNVRVRYNVQDVVKSYKLEDLIDESDSD